MAHYSAEHEMNSDVFRAIERRLRNDLYPSINLRDHIAGSDRWIKKNGKKKFMPRVKALRDTLAGVDFLINDRDKLLQALRAPKAEDGVQSLVEGSSEDSKHWARLGIKGDPDHYALNWSFLATNGIGFREVYRMRLNDRELRIRDARPPLLDSPEMDGRFSGNFGDHFGEADYSALHFAVGLDNSHKQPLMVGNVHIDKLGFVLLGPDGKPVVGPDAGRHGIEELGIKTELRKYLSDKFIDRLGFGFMSSRNEYAKLSISFDIVQTKGFRWLVTGSCGLASGGGWECSGTMAITGTHEIWGSK